MKIKYTEKGKEKKVDIDIGQLFKAYIVAKLGIILISVGISFTLFLTMSYIGLL